MSWHDIRKIKIEPNAVRDWHREQQLAANFRLDVWQTYGVVGLDLLVINRGAVSLTVQVDGNEAVTIDAGDNLSINNTKWAFIQITSTVTYEIVLAGVWKVARLSQKTNSSNR